VTFLVVAAAGVLVVVFIHLLAGWILSNGLHRGALAIRPRARDLTVRVREVSGSRIVLEAPAPRQDIGHPGTLGLAWDGGNGRLGEVLAVDSMRVTRVFDQRVGTPPTCPDALADCHPVEIDPYVFADPSEVGLVYETDSYDAPLGAMPAWLVPGPRSDRWAVLCHGWTAEKRELIRMLPAFHHSGYTTLVIDYRNDPGVPRDPTGRYRFGLSEWEDLEAAVALASDRGARRLVLGGCSTGGALVMAFLERSPLVDQVEGVVLDAPNVMLAEAVRHGTRDRRFTPLMFEFGLWMADLRWKIDWEATNYVGEPNRSSPCRLSYSTAPRTPPSLSR